MTYNVLPAGSISSPSGYRATGIHAGLKPNRERDLALVYSARPCSAAAMFTTSTIKGAPVLFSQALLARNRQQIRAVLINSGIANVGLGRDGFEAAVACARATAEELEIPPESVLLMSTGEMGLPLPIGRMRKGVSRAVFELDSGGGRQAAQAILTTDRNPKEQALRVNMRNDQHFTVAGMAKGGWRVAPRMATMLCLLTTDAALPAPLLARSLRQAVDQSFHCVVLDGDMSPNDTVILLANGASGAAPITAASSWEYALWQEALNALTRSLARMVAEDAGEQSLITIEVSGARTAAEARAVGSALARSRGVRSAWRRGTLNWTATIAALGASGVQVAAEQLTLYCDDVAVAVAGRVQPHALAALPDWNGQRQVVLRLALQQGESQATVWTRA